MRWFLAASLTVLFSCSAPRENCGAELRQISDWGEGQPLTAVPVGLPTALVFHFLDAIPLECVKVRTEPADAFPIAVSAAGRVEFVPSAPGLHEVIVQSWTGKGPSYSLRVMAQTPPPTPPPCVVLPRSCTRVSDIPGFVSCDETLYDSSGQTVSTLDGGDWFGAGGDLFAWEGGLLRRMAVSDAGVTELANSPTLRPRLWAAGAGRLAIGTADGGASFDISGQGLMPQSQFPAAAHVQALAITTTGGVLTAAGGHTDFACVVGGACAVDSYSPSATPDLLAANETGVFVRAKRTFFGSGDPVHFSLAADGGFTDSYFGSLLGSPWIVSAGEQVPRRAHVESIWGMRVEGVAGSMKLLDATRWSSTDGVVWASSATQTSIWCEPR